jgi:hypothetical protein
MNTAAGWSRIGALALLGGAVLMLLARSVVREATPSDIDVAAVYDPLSYYQLVNDEIVEHLRFCPLYADRQMYGEQALSRAAQVQFDLEEDEEGGPTNVPEDCADCDVQNRRLNALFCLSSSAAVTTELASRISRFAELSPLAADMSVPDRWVYGAEGKVMKIREGVHKQRLPDPESTHVLDYRGDITYRSSAAHKMLIDGAGNERLLGGGTGGAQLVEWRNDQVQTLEDGRLQRTTHALPLHLAPAATIYEMPDVEDRIALVVNEDSGLRLLVDGAPIDPTVRSVLAVDRGQVIEIALDDREPLQLRLAGGRTGTLSTQRLTADGRRREIDPESGLDDLVTSLVSAIETTLRHVNDTWDLRRPRDEKYDPERLANADITLTIDRALQLQAVDSLNRFATSEKSPHNSSKSSPRYQDGLWWDGDSPVPFPHMTLTIMDADNGELLALASYPSTQSVVTGLEHASSLSGSRARLLREQLGQELGRTSLHLRPHAIGSIFKPFIAWAAGRADPQLLEFELDPGARDREWRDDLDNNRLLTRCMVSGRRIADKDQSHLSNAYPGKSTSWRCREGTTGEDVCGALAVSDTYYFIELAARIALVSGGGTLPAAGTPDRERDESYELPALCGRQFVYGKSRKRTATCAEQPGASISELLPDACKLEDSRAICKIVHDLDVQLQETNQRNDPSPDSIDGYLGPLADLIRELMDKAPQGCESPRKILLDGFRWAVPLPPQWPQDRMRTCTPDLESFMEGGGLNYWTDIHVAQIFSRLFTGQPGLHARLVAQIDDLAWPQAGERRGPAVDDVCKTLDADPRCSVLKGLFGAIHDSSGTLKQLDKVEEELMKRNEDANGTGMVLTLRGKTGTTRAPFPTFIRKQKEGWVHAMTPRKSVHTALLVEASDAQGNARHYVVYLALNGVDDSLVSKDAAAFFTSDHPGFSVLARLLSDAALDLRAE